MPAPALLAPALLKPAAFKLAALSAVAAAALLAGRGQGAFRRAAALDAAPDGARLSARPVPRGAEIAAEGRLRRLWRARPSTPACEIDFAFLARLRIRRVD